MKIKQAILEIIEKGVSDGNLYYLPNEQLERKVYLEVNKVLECLGGKWNRKLKAHLFPASISDIIDNVLLTGEVTDQKKEFQFFETSPPVVEQLIELANIKHGHNCLEPSAGHGNIAEAMRKIVGNEMVTCIELNSDSVKILSEKGFNVCGIDFLHYETADKYDRIAMNPPFTRQQDIDHVLKALEYLKENGILVSIMSAGVLFRKNKKTLNFWDIVQTYPCFETVDLPENSFKTSGTMVNTIILKIVKSIHH